MKNFLFIPDVNDYIKHIRNVVFTTREFRDDPFYSGIINWIIDNRTPMFFEMSDYKLERSHFTQSFGLFPLRDEYGKGVKNDLFYIHDFLHLMMKYAPFPRSLTFNDFMWERITQEHVISNETEVLTYHRRPDFRAKTFEQTILYDLLVKMNWRMWSVRELLSLRRALADSPAAWEMFRPFASQEEIAPLRKYMDHWASNNIWCGAWYQEFPFVRAPLHDGWKLGFTIDDYQTVESTDCMITQDVYEENMLMNVCYWWEMATGSTISDPNFKRIPNYLRNLEGKIIMPKAAQIYSLALEL